jgi:hypothetical protein
MEAVNVKQIPQIDPKTTPILDFHHHLSDNCGPEALKYNVTEMCIMPSWTTDTQFREINQPVNDFTKSDRYIEKLNEFYRNTQGWHGKIYPFLPLELRLSPEQLSEKINIYKPTGLKLHPLQNFPIEINVLTPYMKIVEDKNLLVYIHTDWTPSTEYGKNRPTIFATFGKIAKMFPQITFIMGHAGNADSFAFAANILKKYPNTYAESSIAPSTWQLERIVRQVDPTRLLFGSNSPYCNLAVELYKIQTLFKVSDLQKEAIFYANAKKLLQNRPFVEV